MISFVLLETFSFGTDALNIRNLLLLEAKYTFFRSNMVIVVNIAAIFLVCTKTLAGFNHMLFRD